MTRRLDRGTRLVVASHNPGKVREIFELVAPHGLSVVSAGDLGLPEPEETGATFAQNALLKAVAAARGAALPSLADDSGIEVEALGGAPGIYSARWAGPSKDFAVAMRRVADELEARGAWTASPGPRANFTAALCLAWPDGETAIFEGKVWGHLVWPPRGSKGFGYDPMFVARGPHLDLRRDGASMPSMQSRTAPAPSSSSPAPASATANADAADDVGFGVYIHWPFCASKCPYCDFNSHVRAGGIEEARFLRAYLRELRALGRAGARPQRLASIFFGGGTPSLMSAATVAAILDAIAGHWEVDAGTEITLEANPSSVEAGRFRDYRAAGINRVSLGVQSLEAADLRALGRLHTVEEALAAIDVSREIFRALLLRPDLRPARPEPASLARTS